MAYKPKYCCECGDKIERINFGILASRRFCELCETNYKLEDSIPFVVLIFGLVFGLIGIGGFFQTAEQPVNVEAKQFSAKAMDANNKVISGGISANEVLSEDRMQAAAEEDVQSKAEIETLRPQTVEKVKRQTNRLEQKNTELPVYFCGAETKKGTACSRKVKGGGRCWQHEGREAMLPQNDLLISH